MDVSTIAAAIIGAKQGQLQLAVAAKILRMNAEQGLSIAKVLEAAQENIQRLANVAAGVGGNVDISV